MTPIFRPVMRVKAHGIHGDKEIVRPSSFSPIRTPGSYPDRVLLLGNGPLAGWGVSSHDNAIPGHLARALTSKTNHAAEVHLKMNHTTTAESLTALARDIDVSEFDAVVVIIGASDALQLLAPRRWNTAIQDVIRDLRDRTSALTEIVVVGIQPPSTVPVFGLAQGGPIDRRAAMFNSITHPFCTGRVHFLSPPTLPRISPSAANPDREDEEEHVSAGYKCWAEVIATKLAALRPSQPKTGNR